jgi:hypothetical protein
VIVPPVAPTATAAPVAAPSPAKVATEPGQRLNEIVSPKAVLADEATYHYNVIRMRGRYVDSGLEAGFPQVWFTDVDIETKPQDASGQRQRAHECRGPFEMGKVGKKFPLGTVIVVNGLFHAHTDSRRPGDRLIITNCSVKKE